MDFINRIFGGGDDREQQPRVARGGPRQAPRSADEQAIERYRYLLKTAAPDTIEQAHAEAFAQLTPDQRQLMLRELTQDLPEAERAAASRQGDDPNLLARTATRAELRRPGTLERSFGGMGMGGGVGFGGMMAGSFLSTIAGVVVGSAIANAFFADEGYDDGGGEGANAGQGEGGEGGEAGADAGGDGGGDSGGFGGDFGGGDFGGGDFGGGEF